jgi:cyclohexyl-isocyanide hydratase
MDRRQFSQLLALLTTSLGVSSLTNGHEMNELPAHWHGKENIGFLIYPGFTALDMVGPHYMLGSLLGAKTFIVARHKNVVVSDTGLSFVPAVTFDECPPSLDILFVPGGSQGTIDAMRDQATIDFLKSRGRSSKYVTSVCTGSLLLAAAGLLQGYRATSHWVAVDSLAEFGAIPVKDRVVIDRNRITGGGVTAGIDFGLTLLAKLRDDRYAQAVQLLAEYDPDPPFDAGSPDKAPQDLVKLVSGMFPSFLSDVSSIAKRN